MESDALLLTIFWITARSSVRSAGKRGHGFAPWSGRIPHAAEQLGP